MRVHATAVATLVLCGCRCGTPEPPEAGPPLPHYGEWNRLVRMVATGAVEAARRVARDLTEGEAAEYAGGEDAAAQVGAALGFLQTLEDGEDAALALVRAAEGCGACHRAAAIAPPARAGSLHRDEGSEALYGVLWLGGDADLAVAAVEACVDCHGKR